MTSTDVTTDRPLAHVSREIRLQPEAWRKAAGMLSDVGGLLPRDGERVAVIGCGTSWFMACAYAQRREALGLGETDYFGASQFPAKRAYDRIVAISRSGTTTEVVRAIEATAVPTLALTAVDESPVTRAANDSIVLPFADEESVVQTLFATTVLMLLRASLGEEVQSVADQAAEVLDGAYPIDTAGRHADQISFLGQGWAYGVAQEAGLKLRESAQLWTESYPQMEYRHGPIAVAQPGRAVWIFGPPVQGIVADIAVTGATLIAADLDPVADLVRAQLLAVDRAQALDLDPDRPRNLTRSVVLEVPSVL